MMKIFKKTLILFLAIVSIFGLQAQESDGYYSPAEGKNKAELKTALYQIIRNHTSIEYYYSSTCFKTTDWNMDGYFWDMYSNLKQSTWGGLNREHSLPKSWFGISSGNENSLPAGTDLHNLYPSDPTANAAKSNYPLGEVTGTPIFTNGVTTVGTNGVSFFVDGTNQKYNGTVFEPANEYKGDFARDYMYMVTCYEDFSERWTSLGIASMLEKNTYPVLKPYAINLLLKWHRNDPVSEKEINRNNAVYAIQKNRNPFIDHPELAEYIWGNNTADFWTLDGGISTEIIPLVIKIDQKTSILKVDFEKQNKPELATYFIRNISGMVILTGKFNTTGTLAINSLNNGVYILSAYIGNQLKTGKFIVAHPKN